MDYMSADIGADHWRSQDFQLGGCLVSCVKIRKLPSPYVLHAWPVFA